ncbi:hypothetical protein OAA62_00960 [bacterium]|nr:hypothetical protein [bacterium]
MEITFDEIDGETFSACVEIQNLTFEIEGTTWTDEIDSLYGDQVSETHLIAYFDTLENVDIFDEDGKKLEKINLEIANKIKAYLKDNMDEEIDSVSHSVNYSPKYYDLI